MVFVCCFSAEAKSVCMPVLADSTNGKGDIIMPSCPYDLTEYFQKNLHYPNKARRKKIDGRVVVSFMVNPSGDISDVSVILSVNKLLDKEARRVVAAMPPWTPGKKDGVSVKTLYKLPVMFKLR